MNGDVGKAEIREMEDASVEQNCDNINQAKEDTKPDTKEESENKMDEVLADEAESKEEKEGNTTKTSKKSYDKEKDKRVEKEQVEEVKEITPLRQLRQRKNPMKYTNAGDTIKFTQEVIEDDLSDIEMIEESDPLAISDTDVKTALQQKDKEEMEVKDLTNTEKNTKMTPGTRLASIEKRTSAGYMYRMVPAATMDAVKEKHQLLLESMRKHFNMNQDAEDTICGVGESPRSKGSLGGYSNIDALEPKRRQKNMPGKTRRKDTQGWKVLSVPHRKTLPSGSLKKDTTKLKMEPHDILASMRRQFNTEMPLFESSQGTSILEEKPKNFKSYEVNSGRDQTSQDENQNETMKTKTCESRPASRKSQSRSKKKVTPY